MSNLIQFPVSAQRPTAGDDVEAILEAHIARERTKAARQFWVHWLALVAGVMGLCLLFPHLASARLEAVLLVLWGAGYACALFALEWRWERREARLRAQMLPGALAQPIISASNVVYYTYIAAL
jgi:hypothetical protein